MLPLPVGNTAVEGSIAAVCYSSGFLIDLDPWAVIHFIDGGFLELFLDDWKLSFTIHALFEVMESSLLTLFGNYLVFGSKSNGNFETANGTILGDLVIDLCGIVCVALIRRAFWRRVPGLWPPLDKVGWRPWMRAAIQLLTVQVLTGITYGGGLGLFNESESSQAVGRPFWSVIVTWLTYMAAAVWLWVLPLVAPRWRRRVGFPMPWGFALALAALWTGAALPAALSVPYTVPLLYAYTAFVIITVTIVYMARGRTVTWQGRSTPSGAGAGPGGPRYRRGLEA